MKRNYILITALSCGGILGFFSANRSAAVNAFSADDKALEKAYQAAADAVKLPEDRGCETIPFPFQRDCKNLGREKDTKCVGLRNCKDQKNPLAQARIKKDSEKIREIRNVCIERKQNAADCALIRNSVQGIFDAAKERVKEDKSKFESELTKAKNEDVKDFNRRMIGYADEILGYYQAKKPTHEDKISEHKILIAGCEEVIATADKPLTVK